MIEADTHATNEDRLRELREAIHLESESLHRALSLYAMRSGLASGHTRAKSVASELLGELTVEALANADRFDPTRQAYPWFLGIAANLIRRKQAEQGKLNRREPLARDMAADPAISDDEVFDRLFPPRNHDPGEAMEQDQQVEALLRLVSADDQKAIRLAVLHELDGAALANALGMKPGAARVRLHRALLRLRKALESQEKRQ